MVTGPVVASNTAFKADTKYLKSVKNMAYSSLRWSQFSIQVNLLEFRSFFGSTCSSYIALVKKK